MEDHTCVERRGLLKLVMAGGLGLVACGAVDPNIAWAEGKGLSRDGVKARFLVGSDLHISAPIGGNEGRDADKKLQFAFDAIYQLDPNLDAFCLVGDITDHGSVAQYEHLMQLINDPTHNTGYNGGAGHTKMILCQGNHETYDSNVIEAPRRFEKYTGQPAKQCLDVNGVKVITMGPVAGIGDGDYRGHYDWFKTQLEQEIGGSSEPFLLLTHHQIKGSSYTSPEWHGNFGQGGKTDLVKLMADYPNLIQVSGHSHATLEDERSISQDLGFTAIQDASIGAYYENETGKVDPDSGDGSSIPPQTSPAYTEGKNIWEASQCVILDFMDDNTVKCHRVSLVRSKVEGEGLVYLFEPWVIDVPSMIQAKGNLSDTQTWKYTSARESTAAPVFPQDAAVTVEEVSNSSAKVCFPAAKPGSPSGLDLVHEYKLVAQAQDGSMVTKRVFGDYFRPVDYIRDSWRVTFKGLAPQTTYTMSVYAQTSWNKERGSEGAGTWLNGSEPAPNSTSAPLVSAPFTTTFAPERPRAILDIDYRTGKPEDAMGHAATLNEGIQIVDDDELGFSVVETAGTTGWGYQLASADYDHFAGASTHECLFKLVDNQEDQCLFSNQQSAGAGFEVYQGKLQFYYNNERAKRILETPVETGTWIHAMATYDGKNVTLYVNGEKKAQASAGRMTIPGPKLYYVCSDTSSEGGTEFLAAKGTRVALARLFPYAMTAGQVATAFAASKLAPAPAAILDVDFDVESVGQVVDAGGHQLAGNAAAGAAIAYDDMLQKNVFACDGTHAFGYAFTADDYTYMGNEHALECVFMASDLETDQCFLSNQQSSGCGLEIAGNGETVGKMAFWFNSNGSGTPKPAGAVQSGVWHHAMGVYNGSSVRMYIDGKLVEDMDAVGGLKVPGEAERVFYVGADVQPGGGPDLLVREGAKIARARILSKAPSAQEIKDLTAGFPVTSKPQTFSVSYAWKDGIAPEGFELPVDEQAYAAGATVTLATKPAAGDTVAGSKDGVAGTWTFEGWDHEDGFEISEDVTVIGIWCFTASLVPGGGAGNGGNGGSAGNGGNDGSTGNGGGSSNTGSSSTGSSKPRPSVLPQTGDTGTLLGGLGALLGGTALGLGNLFARSGNINTSGVDLSSEEDIDSDIDTL